ncbi:MAG: flagellar biosynthetic protein FliR [Pseudomonadota bacterium]
MIEDAPATYVLAIAVLFARVGGVFLIAPGLSSMRAPVRVRLLLALGVTLALSPPLLPEAAQALGGTAPADLLRVLGQETAIGLFIGLMARLFIMAIQFIAVAIANMVGLGGIPGISVDGEEPAQAAATLFTVTAITIMFITDLHHEIIRAAAGSYTVVPVGAGFDGQMALGEIAARAGESFMIE